VAGLARDELVRALTARVRLFAVTFDRAAVLGAQAVDQARALMAILLLTSCGRAGQLRRRACRARRLGDG
jgi:hypothetical protein